MFDACHRRRLRSKLQRYWYAIDSIIRVFEFWLRHLFVWGSLEEKAAAYGGRFSDAPRQMRWVRQQLNGPLGPPSPARWKSATTRRGRHRDGGMAPATARARSGRRFIGRPPRVPLLSIGSNLCGFDQPLRTPAASNLWTVRQWQRASAVQRKGHRPRLWPAGLMIDCNANWTKQP